MIKHSDELMMTLIMAVLLIGVFTLVRIFKYYNECQALNPDNKAQYIKYITHGVVASIISVGVATAITKISENDFISFIPVIGLPFRILGFMNYLVPGLSTALILAMAHFVCNLNENMKENLTPICSSDSGIY
jgi:hypothetical protein